VGSGENRGGWVGAWRGGGVALSLLEPGEHMGVEGDLAGGPGQIRLLAGCSNGSGRLTGFPIFQIFFNQHDCSDLEIAKLILFISKFFQTLHSGR
jgi:hypothetical protein